MSITVIRSTEFAMACKGKHGDQERFCSYKYQATSESMVFELSRQHVTSFPGHEIEVQPVWIMKEDK